MEEDLFDFSQFCKSKVRNLCFLSPLRIFSYLKCKFAEFMSNIFKSTYHESGHLGIGNSCEGPMPFAEASMRDPIFWRWHKHIKDWIKTTIDTRVLPEG